MPYWQTLDEGRFWEGIGRILSDVPHEGNRAKARAYLEERAANTTGSKSTLGTDANLLRNFLQAMDQKSVDTITRDDIRTYLLNPKRRERVWRNRKKDGSYALTKGPSRPYLESTKDQIRIRVRHFMKWLKGTDDYPPEVKGFGGRRKEKDDFDTKITISEEDLKRLLDAAPDTRTKAIIAALHDAGFRAGEFCALNWESFKPDEYGAILELPRGATGLKTGARRPRVIDCVPYLTAWMNIHPFKRDAKAALYQLVKSLGRQAKLPYEVHPHLFRHTAATEKAKLGWTEVMLRKHFGWSDTSDMPSHYVHVGQDAYDRMVLEKRGIYKNEKPLQPALAPLLCGKCGTSNLATAVFCQGCNRPVSPEAEEAIQKQQDEELNRRIAKMIGERLGVQFVAPKRPKPRKLAANQAPRSA
jgi:integrase